MFHALLFQVCLKTDLEIACRPAVLGQDDPSYRAFKRGWLFLLRGSEYNRDGEEHRYQNGSADHDAFIGT